jgi:hypothetical protein
MTTVNVGYGISDPSHDLALQDGTDAEVAAGTKTKLGLIFAGGPRVMQEVPLSPPAQAFENTQENWIGGRGRIKFHDDPTGFFDSQALWTMTDGKIFPQLQWRFASGVRTAHTYLPSDNQDIRWWGLYADAVSGGPEARVTRWLSVSFTPTANITADKAYLYIRRRGTPGTLTFELCSDSTNNPGTVLQTVTKTVSDITDTVSIYQLFDWTGTESLVSGTKYHIKLYGASTDTSTNHWEVLGDIDGTASKYSTNGAAWTTAEITLFFRVTDADTNRQWRFFSLEGALYAAAQNDNNANSIVILLGVRGTASAGTSTTLTNAAAAMTVDAHIGSYIRIFDGTGDGQIRLITDNDATSFTVSPAWDVTPDNTSRYTVASPIASTLTTFSAPLKGKPITVDKVAYFPMGQAGSIRKMQVNASSHDFNSDAVASKADVMYLNLDGPTPLIYLANAGAATIQSAAPVVYASNLTLSTAKSIGSSEYRINSMISHNKVMRVLKEDGIYSYIDGIVQRDGENFSNVPDITTGIGVGAQNSALWFGWAHSLVRQIGTSVDDMLNFKRGYDGMPDDRKGYCSCVLSAVGWLFFVFDGGTSNYSSIIAWNGMGFHEIFRGWAAGVRIRNAFWQGNVNARGRLWFDVGGDLVYIEFPQYAANPLNDSTINYVPEGVIVTATYDAHDQNLYKILSLLRVFNEGGGGIEVDYQTNANIDLNVWTVLGTATSFSVHDLDLNLGEVFRVRVRFRLQTQQTRTAPVLTGWQLSGRMMPLDKYQFLGTFKTDSDQTTFTDEPDHNPNTLYSQLQTWARTQTKLTLRSATQSSDSKIVTVSLPSKSVDWIDSGENKWGGRITAAILET